MKKFKVRIKQDDIVMNEIEYLIFVSFLYRLEKEIYWFLKKTKKAFFISSASYSFLNAYVSNDKIRIILKNRDYLLNLTEFNSLFVITKCDLRNNYPVSGLDYNALDGVYMGYMLAIDLPYLLYVKEEVISLKDLLIFSIDKSIKHVSESEHLCFLTNKENLEIKTLTNLHNQSHKERFNEILDSFKKLKYGENNQYIIVYNNDNIIRDGTHRAAILYLDNPNQNIKVLRFFFSKNYYTFENYFNTNGRVVCFESLLKSTNNTRFVKANTFNTNLIRSDYIPFNSEDIDTLKNMNVTTIIDLRNFKDKEKPFFLIDNFNWINITIFHANKKKKEDNIQFVKNLNEYYLYLLAQKEAFRNIFNYIKESSNKILINCMIGKDRTGIVAMLCEMLLGSSDEEIICEYLLTDEIYQNQRGEYEHNTKYHDAKKKFSCFLECFRYTYHDVNTYLINLGFSNEDIQKIITNISGDE